MKQTNKLLQKYFDTALESPEGIKKLRELILTLAMQGKLVPQNPNDPPASELLKVCNGILNRGSIADIHGYHETIFYLLTGFGMAGCAIHLISFCGQIRCRKFANAGRGACNQYGL